MYRGHSISIVIPCYNEENSIGELIGRIPKFVDEVVIIDNGSTDRTADIAKKAGACVLFEAKRGYGRSYKRGFQNAKGDIIVTMDGDGSYPTEYIQELVNVLIENDQHFISASRFPLGDKYVMPLRNLIGNKILTFLTNILFSLNLKDSQSGMWIFKKSLLSGINLTDDGMAFSEEFKIEAFLNRRIRAKEYPICYKPRIGKVKLHPWKDGARNLMFLFKIRFNGKL